MADPVPEVAKDFFMTVHVKGQDYGEIEPHFHQQYRGELEGLWHLYLDKMEVGLPLLVRFRDDDENPALTHGWMSIRRLYRFTGHHQLLFKYLGNRKFYVIPVMKPITPAEFPTWHSQTRALRKAVSFKITLEHDPEVVPYLELPEELGEYLWDTNLGEIFIVGTNGEKMKCDMTYQFDSFLVTIQSGWKECVAINEFKVGDELLFTISNVYENHEMRVRKIA